MALFEEHLYDSQRRFEKADSQSALTSTYDNVRLKGFSGKSKDKCESGVRLCQAMIKKDAWKFSSCLAGQ